MTIPTIIRCFNQRYIDYLRANFNKIGNIHWRKFEGLTAEFFERQGYFVEIGPGRADGGVDVRVWTHDTNLAGPPTILIQCKRQKDLAGMDKKVAKSTLMTLLLTTFSYQSKVTTLL
ncbi:restriction endonuclease [Paenibacillus sp. OAS669]|uniref:restriction endonuclease n=1 Tax=Paenibacillus sp. OAS669 TaxID=2663821 RepID=UPI001789ED78|nr:restriction endonuclease [Paenibacillus sp. OAS669]MBE1443842.1 hypothetical protein [Paenibacillus sp. OAS669]